MRTCLAPALVMILGQPAVAQADYSVFPTVIDLERDPGKAAVGTFNVDLRGEGERQFAVYVQDAIQQPDGSFAYSTPVDSAFSASSWISASPRRFSGSPNRKQPIQYRVRVPQRADPGTHLTSLVVVRLPRGDSTTAAPAQAVAVRFAIEVSGRARPQAEVTLDGPAGVTGNSQVTVGATVRNTGNVVLDFDAANNGSISVVKGSDERARFDFEGLIYPAQSRYFELSWEEPPLVGIFDARVDLDVGEQVERASKSFVVIPWRQVGALLLIGLAAAVLVIGARRRRATNDPPSEAR